MARKNRRLPFACPIEGCGKRGLRAGLMQHAAEKHPEVTREAYQAAMVRGQMIGPPRYLAARWKTFLPRRFNYWAAASQTLNITAVVLLIWVAIGR